MSTQSSSSGTNNNQPRFSALGVTVIITLFWALVFAFTLWHGIDGVRQQNHLIAESQDR